MTIIKTTYTPELEFYDMFTIWIRPPDPFGYAGDGDYIDVEMYCHSRDNERRLLNQLDEILSKDDSYYLL